MVVRLGKNRKCDFYTEVRGCTCTRCLWCHHASFIQQLPDLRLKNRKAKSGNNRNHTKIMACIHNNRLHVWDSLAFSITFITIIIIM